MTHPSQADLRRFLAGNLSPAEAGPIALHLDGCPDCQGRAEGFTAVPRELWASLVVATDGSPAPDGPATPRIPGFEGLHELARGGSGVIYRATEAVTGREVALKVLRGGALASPAEQAWFTAEARAAAGLRHPNVVTVLSVGEAHELPYYAMEYLPGGSLADSLDGVPLPPARAAGLVEAVARAVQHAHEAGVIHRDLKPGNILLDGAPGPSGSWIPKVSDFGMAKRHGPTPSATPTQAVLGTPSYMAPEQAFGRSREVGPPADVYGLGAILYELLTGHPPFRGGTPYETLLLVRDEEPVPLRRLRPGLPRDLETVCLKCLEKDPGRRYPTAALLADDLRAYLEGRPVSARPVGRCGRLSRWARREPAVAGLSAMSSLLFLALFVLVTASWRRAEAQRTRLAEVALQAETRGAQLLDVLVFSAEATSKLFLNPELVSQADRATLIRGLEAFEQVPDLPGSPDQEHKLAYATLQMANGLYALGEAEHSERATRRAVATLRRLSLEFPDRPQIAYHYAQGCMQLAGLAMVAGQRDEEMRYHEEAVGVAEDLVTRHPSLDGYAADLAAFRSQLAMDLVERGRDDEAEPLLEQSLDANRSFVASYPTDPIRYEFYRVASNVYGDLLLRRHDAVDRYWELARERMELCARARAYPDWHLIARKLLRLELAVELEQAGWIPEADHVLAHGLGVWGELSARDPPTSLAVENHADWLIADGYRRWESDPGTAAQGFRRALGLLGSIEAENRQQVVAIALAELLVFCPDPSVRDPARALAYVRGIPGGPDPSRNLLGVCLFEVGEHAAARAELERFLAEATPPAGEPWEELARLYLALALTRLGEPDLAAAELDRARAAGESGRVRSWNMRSAIRRAKELLAD